ncbi:MAG: FliO/MopB family protein [Candidatus Brocadiia bacterium]
MSLRRILPLLLAAVAAFGLAAPALADDAEAPEPPEQAAPDEEEPTGGEQAEPEQDEEEDEGGYLDYEEPGVPQSPGILSIAGRVVGSLALVVGLIVVTALVLRRWLGGTKAPATNRKVSELVEVTPLGGKRFLYLIRVADRLLVVGGGGERLALLTEIRDPEVLEQVQALPRRSDFFELFHRARGEGRGEGAPGEQPAEQRSLG